MAQKKIHSMPVFGDAYLADTTHLTTEEHGAYFLLLLAAWRQRDCSLPNEDKKLARIAGLSPQKWRSMKDTILEFWTIDGPRIFQKRQRKEHRWVEQKREGNRENSIKGWKKRKGGASGEQDIENKGNGLSERNANEMPDECDKDAPPPPPPPPQGKSSSVKDRESNTSYRFSGSTIRLTEEDFEKWENAYSAIPDLEAELQSLDDWISKQDQDLRKKWFFRISGILSKKHQAAVIEQTRPARQPGEGDPADPDYVPVVPL